MHVPCYGTLLHGDVTSKTCATSHELTHETTILGNYEMKWFHNRLEYMFVFTCNEMYDFKSQWHVFASTLNYVNDFIWMWFLYVYIM